MDGITNLTQRIGASVGPNNARAVRILLAAFLLALGLAILMWAKLGWAETIAGRDFAIDFVSSIWASLVFFSIIGVATLIIQIHDPSSDNFEVRVGYLFNKDDLDSSVRTHLISRVNKIACFTKKLTVDITVISYDAAIECYKVEIKYRVLLSNTTKDVSYVDDTMIIQIRPEIVENAPSGVIGCITEITLGIPSINEVTPIISSLQELVFGADDSKEFRQDKVKLVIPKNDCAELFMWYWIWGKVGCATLADVYRYTQCLQVRIRNKWKGGTVRYKLSNESNAETFSIDFSEDYSTVKNANGISITPTDGPHKIFWVSPVAQSNTERTLTPIPFTTNDVIAKMNSI